MDLVGRKKEQITLSALLASNRAEFLAVYGRRRVGKTYLIKHFFKAKKVTFLRVTGAKNAPMREQIQHFNEQVRDVFFNGVEQRKTKNWNEAFRLLSEAMATVPKLKKVVLFFDEFPWMASKNSRLLQNLEYYWNQLWSDDNRIKLIICGSSASWIVDKIINNKSGLHNRITESMLLEPFNLKDTKSYLNKLGVKLNNQQVLQLYMVTGGVPYYLNKVKPGLTATQIIEQLAFRKNSFLLQEFDNLFASLFDNAEVYIKLIKTIAASRYGIGQKELFDALDMPLKGYSGLSKLDALERSGFIMSFVPHFRKSKGIFYKVVDEYTLFYCHWIEPIKKKLLQQGLRRGYWERAQLSPAWRSWSGYAFESICYKHLIQISLAFNLSPAAIPDTWRYVPPKKSTKRGAQIDLLFDRDDGAVTVCEIKYTETPFKIDKDYARKLQQKMDVFTDVTKSPKQLFLSMIVSSGLRPSMYSEEMIDSVITADALFKSGDE
jgi:hypothetical protein